MCSKLEAGNIAIIFACYSFPFYTLKIEAICHYETQVNSNTAQCNSKEDGTLYFQRHCLEICAKLL
jgi:hypothetical protein